MAADRGARVIVDCQPELLGLLRSISQISTLVRPGEPLPVFDFQIPMMSLPMAFETSLEISHPLLPIFTRIPQEYLIGRVVWGNSVRYGI